MTSAIVKASLAAFVVGGASILATQPAAALPGLDRGVASAQEQATGVEKVWGCGPWGCRGWGGGYGWRRPYYGWRRPYYGGYGWRRPYYGGYGWGGYGWGGGYPYYYW
jgi:hypothetical protein